MTKPIGKDEPKPASFLDRLSNPARRALLAAGIATVRQLAQRTEKEVLKLHGVGPASLPTFRAALAEARLSFKTENAK